MKAADRNVCPTFTRDSSTERGCRPLDKPTPWAHRLPSSRRMKDCWASVFSVLRRTCWKSSTKKRHAEALEAIPLLEQYRAAVDRASEVLTILSTWRQAIRSPKAAKKWSRACSWRRTRATPWRRPPERQYLERYWDCWHGYVHNPDSSPATDGKPARIYRPGLSSYRPTVGFRPVRAADRMSAPPSHQIRNRLDKPRVSPVCLSGRRRAAYFVLFNIS